jgi:hypothetical protein
MSLRPLVEHNHLDRQRRERGECPACDAAWDRQNEKLAATTGSRNVIKALDRAAKKVKPMPNWDELP